MFSSTVLDVIVGVVTVFLAISLIASAMTEAVSTLMGLRATTLLAGIQKLLNDPNLTGLAGTIYNSGLVNPLSDGTAKPGNTPKTLPSYIQSAAFASALIDSVQKTATDAETLGDAINKIGDEQIKAALATLYNKASGDMAQFHLVVGAWFDAAMARVSGDYKRWTKLITFAIGFATAAALNADPVHVVETLWQRPVAVAVVQGLDPANARKQAETVLQNLNAAGPLIGWSDMPDDDRRWHGAGLDLMILGWLITAGATLFGAPFWFDLLQRFVQLRGTGDPVKSMGANPAKPGS